MKSWRPLYPVDVVFSTYIYNHWLTQKYSEFWLVRYNGLIWSNIAIPLLLPSYIYDHWFIKMLTSLMIQILFQQSNLIIPLIIVNTLHLVLLQIIRSFQHSTDCVSQTLLSVLGTEWLRVSTLTFVSSCNIVLVDHVLEKNCHHLIAYKGLKLQNLS